MLASWPTFWWPRNWLVSALLPLLPSAFNFLFGRALGSCNEGEKKPTSFAVVFMTSIFLAVIALFLFIMTFV